MSQNILEPRHPDILGITWPGGLGGEGGVAGAAGQGQGGGLSGVLGGEADCLGVTPSLPLVELRLIGLQEWLELLAGQDGGGGAGVPGHLRHGPPLLPHHEVDHLARPPPVHLRPAPDDVPDTEGVAVR